MGYEILKNWLVRDGMGWSLGHDMIQYQMVSYWISKSELSLQLLSLQGRNH